MNIYIITTMSLGYEGFPKSSRVWGWFDNPDKARKAVEENWNDISEDRSYPSLKTDFPGISEFKEKEGLERMKKRPN